LLRLSLVPIYPKQGAVFPWETDQDTPQAEAPLGRYSHPVTETHLPYRKKLGVRSWKISFLKIIGNGY